MSSKLKAKKDFWKPYEKDINEMKIGETAYVPRDYINLRIDKVLNSMVEWCMPVSEIREGTNAYPIIRTENGFYFKRADKRDLKEYEAKETLFKEAEEENNRIKENLNLFSLVKNGEFYLLEEDGKEPLIRIPGVKRKIIKTFGEIRGDRHGR